jgi:hypothetical protein
MSDPVRESERLLGDEPTFVDAVSAVLEGAELQGGRSGGWYELGAYSVQLLSVVTESEVIHNNSLYTQGVHPIE